MFKRINKTLVVGKSSVTIADGTHDIYVDTNSLNAFIDINTKDNDNKNLKKIATYQYNEKTKEFTIQKEVVDFKEKKILKNMIIGRSMWNNSRIHMGPLYDEDGDDPVAGYIEGLPIDFNYQSFVMSTLSLALYDWIGGRSCFAFLFDLNNDNVPFYTARAFMGCGTFGPEFMFELSISIICPIAGVNALTAQANNWIYNRWSFVYFLFSHRRYTDVQINNNNMFTLKIIEDGIEKDISFSPLNNNAGEEYSIPDFNDDFSMFNLMQ